MPAAYVARLAAFLASDAAAGINGQLFGVRGREIFVFSQPRPREHVVQAPDEFDPALMKQLEPGFADLVTDLEAFSGDPIL